VSQHNSHETERALKRGSSFVVFRVQPGQGLDCFFYVRWKIPSLRSGGSSAPG